MTQHPITRFICLIICLLPALVSADIIKSPNDSRTYRTLTLENQLQVLLISDASADKAAAALDVATGSNDNPPDRQGLAHFLEHMLFLGTEKYPDAGDYQAFIQANGGNHNAFTAATHTNYFFNVRAGALDDALDRFAQFFIAPLFTAEYVDRERHAVYSEYQAKIRDDFRRSHAAIQQAMNPAHPASRFAVGALETLSDRPGATIRDDLINFYKTHYSANQMKLAVLGPQSLDELQAMVENRFNAVANIERINTASPVPLFRADQLPAQLKIKTLKDYQALTLTFPMPGTEAFSDTKPLHYIASQLGYEGAGSLLAVLKAKGWASALSASADDSLPEQSQLSLYIQLTPQGLEQYQAVVQSVFDAVKVLQTRNINTRLFTEQRQLNQLAFRFKEPGDAMHTVSQLAYALHRYPAEQVLVAPYQLNTFDEALIQRFASHIKPDNMLLVLEANKLTTDATEHWYQTPYSLNKLSRDDIQQLSAASPVQAQLSARQPNPFIASDLTLEEVSDKAQHADTPQQLINSAQLSLWHLQDHEFRLPKADIYLSVLSADANRSARSAVLTQLYTQMLTEQLNEPLYDAYLAGLSADIYPHMRGFGVRISGYNDKQSELMDVVINAIRNPEFDTQRFARLKQAYAQQLANSLKDKPYNRTLGEIFQLLMPQWSTEAKLDALTSVSLDDLRSFVPQLLANPQLRMLAHGNLTAPHARELAAEVKERLVPDNASPVPVELPIVKLAADQPLTQTLALEHNDSAISVYFQGPDTRLQTRADFALLNEILSSPFYTRLRTEQQLGYIVFGTPLPLRSVPGLAFVIQSPVASPVELEDKINAFMQQMQDELAQLKAADLEEFKQSLTSRVMQQETRLNERTQRFWREIDRNALDFQSRERLARAVEQITPERLRAAFAQLGERRLTVRSFGTRFASDASGAQLSQRCDMEIANLKRAENVFADAAADAIPQS